MFPTRIYEHGVDTKMKHEKNINSEIKLIYICFDEIKTGVGNISTIISFSQGLRCDCQEKRGSLARITLWQFIMCHEVRRLKLGRINKPWPHVLVIALRFQHSKFQKLYFLKVELKED